jgi:Ca2+-binding RTX toxin-like protein
MTQESYTELEYSGLTNFDTDQSGDIYAIADRNDGARLIRLNSSGNEISSRAVTDGASEISASPSGNAVFYILSDSDKKGRVYRSTNQGDAYKDSFTSGGVGILPDKIEAIDDDTLLLAWTSEYETNAPYPNWLPKAVKIGRFSFSSAGEPSEVWTWTPQWTSEETNLDGDPSIDRLGDTWNYFLSRNPGTGTIHIYTTHHVKFLHAPTGRNHYCGYVTHVYEDDGAEITELPRTNFADWTNISEEPFSEPFYTRGGVLMYRINNKYLGSPNFVRAVQLADPFTEAAIEDEIVESWVDDLESVTSLGNVWQNLPDAHVEIVSHYWADYQNNLYVVHGTRNVDTEETISLALVKFKPEPDGGGPGNTIIGTPGDDSLQGSAFDDTIIGLGGRDRLEGGAGNDTYVWNPGDGEDTIYDYAGSNVLRIGEGVTPGSVILSRGGTDERDLVFEMPEGGSVTVEGWFSGDAYQLSEVRFANGTVWTRDDINSTAPPVTPTTGQIINGTSANDVLTGGAAGDTIYGKGGNDLIEGGRGDDFLEGGAGNDTYVYNYGDGHDTIYDNLGTNILQLGSGINPSDVTFTRRGTSYRDAVFIMPDGGSVTVERWFSGSAYQLSEIRFSNGTIWTKAIVNAMSAVFKGTDAGETISGTTGNDDIYGLGGNDKLVGNAGNDILRGGPGDDRLEGGTGNDTYIYNPNDNNDTIYDLYGTNVLQIGAGINPADVKFTRSGTSYRDAVFIMPSGESITVERWFSGSAYQLSKIQFANGTEWTKANVNAFSPLFEGTSASETINGSPGHDTIIGNAGNDRLEGGSGNDTYIYNQNDNSDTIYDSSGTNILKIGAGISPSGVQFTRGGTSYRDAIFIMPSGERITVERWFTGSAYRLSEVQFSNGTTWTKVQITAMSAQFEGSDAGETITGTSGNDTIVGGGGNDRLEGKGGNDTYIWAIGDGSDVIEDNLGTNVLQIGAGVTPADVKFSRSGTSYRDAVFIMPSGESITVERWFYVSSYQLSEIRFANGEVWTKAYINNLEAILEGTDNDDTIDGTSNADVIYGYDGNDTITASGGNDTLVGGAGDDYLEGETGNDTYIWGLGDGNDNIYDSSGTNVLEIGEGVEPADVKFTRSGTSYRDAIFIMPGDERITVERWFSGSGYQLSEIRFDDGTVWTKAIVNAFSPLYEGTDADETLQGSPGNDTLIGGAGNDRLEGGSGNDTYIWSPGDNNDTIYDNLGTNVLEIGEDVDPTTVALTRSGNNLVIQLEDEGAGSVTIEKWYSGTSYQLSSIKFADGTTWPRADITAIAAGTKAPYSVSASGTGKGSALSNYEDGPIWSGTKTMEETDAQEPGTASSGGSGCDTGVMGLVGLVTALAVRLLARKGKQK